jgi:hypothetical protein
MRERRVSIARVLVVYVAGLVAGIQCALYLFDRFDDGVADVRSLYIGLGMVALGLGFVGWSFRTPGDTRSRSERSTE